MTQQVWDVQDDPMAAAMDAERAAAEMERQFATVYGLIEFDIWFCALVKGTGKVPYDPAVHNGQRLTNVGLAIQPIMGSYRFPIERSFIAEFKQDGWLSVTHPSLKALGENPSTINGKYVKAELVKYGEYTAATGEVKPKTAPKILAVYQNEDEAMAAANAELTQVHHTSVEDIPTGLPANGHTNGNSNQGNDAERATAKAFLVPMLKPARNGNGIDLNKVGEIIKSNPLLSKYFDLTSPEVIEATQAVLADPVF